METTLTDIPTTSGSSSSIILLIVSSMLVFLMQGGFSFLEVGFTRTKNTVSTFMKNMIGFAFSFLAYLTIGCIFSDHTTEINWVNNNNSLNILDFATLLFNASVAALVTTIATGAMSERMSFKSSIATSILIAGLIYPFGASWLLTTGWLSKLSMPFYDLGGSSTIQLTAGMLALSGALVLGPRNDKRNFRTKPIPGQNLSYSALGLFILWFGWMGLHTGMGILNNANIAVILLNTNIAACSATIATMACAWVKFGKPSFSLTINGTVAGLAAISAGCNIVSPLGAIVIGLLSGILLVFSVSFIESKLRVDDPVGASSIHAVCGGLGIILTGILSTNNGLLYSNSSNLLISQTIGLLSIGTLSFLSGLVIFFILKWTIKLRVEKRLEEEGLDIYEHGESAYN